MSLTKNIGSAAAGSAITAVALTGSWWTPKPPPPPSVPVNAKISMYVEECESETKCIGQWYIQGWGRFDMKTGKELPLDNTPIEPWEGMQVPRYTIKTTVPLPKIETLQSEVLVIDQLPGTTAGGSFVIRDGKWVPVPQ